jgi:hypothetical protein
VAWAATAAKVDLAVPVAWLVMAVPVATVATAVWVLRPF